MIALIAFVPAICVLLVALFTQSKSSTAVAAVIAGLVGLLGGPEYTALDLICVGIATIFAFNTILSKKLSYEEKVKRDEELKAFDKKLDAFHSGFVKIAVVGIVIFSVYSWNQMTSRTTQQAARQPAPAPSTYPAPAQRSAPSLKPTSTQNNSPKAAPHNSRKTATDTPVIRKSVPMTPMQKCLAIRDEGLMMDCLAETP